jgi:hypothetical protein
MRRWRWPAFVRLTGAEIWLLGPESAQASPDVVRCGDAAAAAWHSRAFVDVELAAGRARRRPHGPLPFECYMP